MGSLPEDWISPEAGFTMRSPIEPPMQGHDCTCPAGSDSSVPATEPLTDPAYLGVTGDPDFGAAGVVEPYTLDEFCHPHPQGSGTGPENCGSGCGGSNGDPHLHPFNADPYESRPPASTSSPARPAPPSGDAVEINPIVERRLRARAGRHTGRSGPHCAGWDDRPAAHASAIGSRPGSTHPDRGR